MKSNNEIITAAGMSIGGKKSNNPTSGYYIKMLDTGTIVGGFATRDMAIMKALNFARNWYPELFEVKK